MKLHTAENFLNHGLLMQQQGDFMAAYQAFSQATQINPASSACWMALAELCLQYGYYDKTTEFCEHAIECDPESSRAYILTGAALSGQAQYEDAELNYVKARTLQPDMLDAIAGEADALVKQGKPKDAFECIRNYVSNTTVSPAIAIVFADVAAKVHKEKEASDLLEALLGKNTFSPLQQIQMHFAIGKLYDQMDLYDKAFIHYKEGNKLSPHTCSTQKDQKLFEILTYVFSKTNLANFPVAKTGDLQPVFIIGMPRSGTSLVEQILSCHSKIYAGGEMQTIPDIAQNMPALLGVQNGFPGCIESLSEEAVNKIVQEYYFKMERLTENKKIITDKLPHNFLLLGLINVLFPNARIIHCMRNPLDTCLSIYFQFFSRSNAFDANDLTTIGHHYKRYQDLMWHWKQVLNIQIMDVKYEDVIEQQEDMSRKILEFCSLSWEENCLAFHKSRRISRTASHEQVRQPIYPLCK